MEWFRLLIYWGSIFLKAKNQKIYKNAGDLVGETNILVRYAIKCSNLLILLKGGNFDNIMTHR